MRLCAPIRYTFTVLTLLLCAVHEHHLVGASQQVSRRSPEAGETPDKGVHFQPQPARRAEAFVGNMRVEPVPSASTSVQPVTHPQAASPISVPSATASDSTSVPVHGQRQQQRHATKSGELEVMETEMEVEVDPTHVRRLRVLMAEDKNDPMGLDSGEVMMSWLTMYQPHTCPASTSQGAGAGTGKAKRCACECSYTHAFNTSELVTADALAFYISPVVYSYRGGPLTSVHFPWKTTPLDIKDRDAVKALAAYPGLKVPGRRSHYPPPPLQTWIGLSLEALGPEYHTGYKHAGLVDVEVSYRQQSDVWWTYATSGALQDLRRPLPYKPDFLAPVCVFISNCVAANPRLTYLQELMMFIGVDSFGRCLHNRDEDDVIRLLELNPNRDRFVPHTLSSKSVIMRHYKFVFSFENTLVPDYVTEKFYEPLRVGTVPIYMGAPNIHEYLPAPNAIIMAEAYRSPHELAEHLLALAHDSVKYEALFEWKRTLLRPRAGNGHHSGGAPTNGVDTALDDNLNLDRESLFVRAHEHHHTSIACSLCRKLCSKQQCPAAAPATPPASPPSSAIGDSG